MTTSFKKVQNNAKGQLSAGISAAATSIVLKSGEGANFPATGDFWVTLFSSTVDQGNEIVLCTGRSTDTLTVTRAQCDTLAAAWSADDHCQLLVLAEHLEETQAAITAIEDGTTVLDSLETTGDVTVGGALNLSGGSFDAHVTFGSEGETLVIRQGHTQFVVVSDTQTGTVAVRDQNNYTRVSGTTSAGMVGNPPHMSVGAIIESFEIFLYFASGTPRFAFELCAYTAGDTQSDIIAWSGYITSSGCASEGGSIYSYNVTGGSLPYTIAADSDVMLRIVLDPNGAGANTVGLSRVDWTYRVLKV